MDWERIYRSKLIAVEEAAAKIKSNDRVISSPCSSAPSTLIDAITKRYRELSNVTMTGALILYPFDYLKDKYIGHIKHHTIFMGPYERKMYGQGNVDVTSFCFSQADWLVRNRIQPTVSIIEVSPPDDEGNMSFGPLGTFYNAVANEYATTVICQVNREAPYVYGTKDAFINVKDATWICEADHPLGELPNAPATDLEHQIAAHVLEHLEDGITLQIGVGGVANAIGF